MLDDLVRPLGDAELWVIETILSDWFLIASAALFGIELLRYRVKGKLSWKIAGDSAASLATQIVFVALEILLIGAVYIGVYFTVAEFAVFQIERNWATVALCVVLADLAYYWEHRFTHRVALGWATHSVHHSSPYFNISVAYRFGPMDDLWPLLFNLPLVLIGFDPVAVLFSLIIVLVYQTLLHTELVGKLPRPIEYIFNTPSHHRVHHGSNPDYLDKNYGGVLIVWDRVFGTFAEEREDVVYGLVEPINSNNPLVVFFHGIQRLAAAVRNASGLSNKLTVLLRPPGWKPDRS